MRGLKTLLLIALAGGCWWAPAWAQPVVTMGAAPAPGNGFFIYHSTGGGFPPMPPMDNSTFVGRVEGGPVDRRSAKPG